MPDNSNPFITVDVGEILRDTLVKSLMLLGIYTWDTNLVRGLFNARDAQLILGIPLSFQHNIDRWSWFINRKGECSVRSAYDHLRHNPNSDLVDLWKMVWSIKVPPKVKALLWHAAFNILPMCDNLLEKHVVVANICYC